MKTTKSILSSAVSAASRNMSCSALVLATALALPAVANAESTFTPYLVVDASIGYVDKDTSGKQNDFDYYNGNIATSVFGARASHDLGNGLTVKGWLEGDFNTATGDVSASGVFRREANIGLAGSFGEVSVGTRVNPLLIMNGARFAMAGNSSSTSAAIFSGFGDFFINKSVTYIAPKVGGLTAQVMYGFEDNDGSLNGKGPNRRESLASGYARYEASNFWFGVAAQQINGAGETAFTKSDGSTVLDSGYDEETGIIAAGTELAGWTLKASFTTHKAEDAAGVTVSDIDTWQVGTNYAFSPQLKAGVDYVRDDEGSSLMHVRGQYSLSKNLTFYAMLNRADTDANGVAFPAMGPAGSRPAAGESEIGIATGAIVKF